MNNSIANKNVSIGGKVVITDWRQVRIVSPENMQDKIKANEIAKEEIRNQKEVTSTSNNSTAEVA